MKRIKGSIHPWSGHLHSQYVLPRVSNPDSNTEHCSSMTVTAARQRGHTLYMYSFYRRCPLFYINFERTFQVGYITMTLPCIRTNITGMETGSKVWGESQHDMGYILYWNYLKQIGKILVHRLYCTGKQIYAVLVNRICWDICPK